MSGPPPGAGTAPALPSSDLVRIWDGTRRSIEAFDKSIADIRRFYLTVLAAIVTIAAGFLQTRMDLQGRMGFVVESVALVIVTFTLIFWGLDTHYHGYLRVAAATADAVEEHLKLVGVHWGVTAELGAFREQGAIAARIFHLIYLFPAAVALLAMWVVELQDFATRRYLMLALPLSVILIVVALLFLLVAERSVDRFSAGHVHRGPAGPGDSKGSSGGMGESDRREILRESVPTTGQDGRITATDAQSGQPTDRVSRFEGLTPWGKAKAILSGKSRGGNLIILGVFFLVASGVSDVLTSSLGVPSETGFTLRMLAMLSAGAGMASYLRGN